VLKPVISRQYYDQGKPPSGSPVAYAHLPHKRVRAYGAVQFALRAPEKSRSAQLAAGRGIALRARLGYGGEPGKLGSFRTDPGLRPPGDGRSGPSLQKKGSSPWATGTTPIGGNFNLIKAPPHPSKSVQG
jgi:hypothetical protein